ncbi:MAG: four helix bundle suffix domain-containing protein [Bacteroides sp.]|nr:four helix bundle suffix domain-containing protein [Bacteroides sp.]MCM1379746.1 four helix bundle suffix domain-containing protein [Bacteroides sp.]MCM1445713.1 four helix bundle suffix domain-containing protein [Prevotella sp.]
MSNFLPKAGGYRNLLAYQLSEAIYDLTVVFTRRFLQVKDRTVDQMVQAARSGKQNIAEGSAASATSKETEIKLTNVAKASLEELLLDYQDYLRVNNLQQWSMNYHRLQRLRNYIRSDEFKANPTANSDRYSPEEYCNLCITLINQTTYLLRKLIEKQQQQFLEQGGIKELMYRARINYRNNPHPTDRFDKSDTSDKSKPLNTPHPL